MSVPVRLIAVIAALAPSVAIAQQPAPTRNANDVVTVLGCVAREADYRSTIADGRGGTAGSGLGVGNEFVLRAVRAVSGEPLRPVVSAPAGTEDVYSVTGNLERELARVVGQRVAVSGYVEVAKSDGTQKVRDLPRLNAIGWHVVSDRCPATADKR